MHPMLLQENARRVLETGLTTVCDLVSSDNMDLAMRVLINRGAMHGTRMLLADNGRYSSSPLYKVGAVPDLGHCNGVAEVQRVARQQLAAGADRINRQSYLAVSHCCL